MPRPYRSCRPGSGRGGRCRDDGRKVWHGKRNGNPCPIPGNDSCPPDILFPGGSSVAPKSYLLHEILLKILPPQRSISKCGASMTRRGRWLAVGCCRFLEPTSPPRDWRPHHQTGRPAKTSCRESITSKRRPHGHVLSHKNTPDNILWFHDFGWDPEAGTWSFLRFNLGGSVPLTHCEMERQDMGPGTCQPPTPSSPQISSRK